MSTYGYIRVSTKEQNPERQIAKMRELGVPAENLFVDKASGKDLDRDAYKALMDEVSAGDELLFDSLDRLGRSYDDIVSEWKRLTREVGVSCRALDLEFFDSAKFDAMGSMGRCVEDMLLSLLAYVAQTERDKNRQRQAEGIAIAKAQGKYKGRKPIALDDDKMKIVKEMLESGATKQKVADAVGISKPTLYRMMHQGRIA